MLVGGAVVVVVNRGSGCCQASDCGTTYTWHVICCLCHHHKHNAGLLLPVHAHRHAKSRPDVASAVSCSKHHVAGDSHGGDGGGAADSDDDYEGQVVFSDVPMEVVQVILQHLDPISLAAAACVCR
jgi:hypothetical protein